MPRPSSNDLCLKIALTVGSGTSCRQAAGLLEVSVSFVIKLMQRVRATGDVAPAQLGGYKVSPLAAHEADLRRWAVIVSREAGGSTASRRPRRPPGRRHSMNRMIGLLANHGHWKTTTFIAALRHDGITAPCVFDGPIDGASFKAPPPPPGGVHSMDRTSAS